MGNLLDLTKLNNRLTFYVADNHDWCYCGR